MRIKFESKPNTNAEIAAAAAAAAPNETMVARGYSSTLCPEKGYEVGWLVQRGSELNQT